MSNLRQSYGRIAQGDIFKNLVPTPILIPSTDDGTPTGSANMAVNASLGAPIEFWIQPPPGTIYQIFDNTLSISDSGSLGQTDYGSLSQLPNGIEFFFEFDGVRTPVIVPVRSNAQLFGPVSSQESITFGGGIRVIRLTQAYYDFSEGITLNGDTNDKIIAKLQDDMTGLNTHALVNKGQMWRTSF